MTVLWSALFAGLVAVGASVAIERLGGRLGGVVGTTPSTIVPASLGIWAAAEDPERAVAALAVVPVGMLLNAGFLWLWRVVPPRLPALGLPARLAMMSAVSLGAWSVGAGLVAVSVPHLLAAGLPPLALGLAAMVVGLAAGVAACWGRFASPRGSVAVPLGTLLARGTLAALAVAVAVHLASLDLPLVSGVASVFPAIFLTAMAGVWLSQGEAVPAGAVGPMMLGSLSVSAYALLATLLFPLLGPALGAAIAWSCAVVGVSGPIALWLARRAGKERPT